MIPKRCTPHGSKSRAVKWHHIKRLLHPHIISSPSTTNLKAVKLECDLLGITHVFFGSAKEARQFIRYRLNLIEEMLKR